MINLNKKKKIVLLILAIPFTRSLIHYFFYPERIMRSFTFEEKLNLLNRGKKWTGEYYSFGDHLGFSFSKNHEFHSIFLYENFDIFLPNGLWLYLPATLLVLFLIWIFDGKN